MIIASRPSDPSPLVFRYLSLQAIGTICRRRSILGPLAFGGHLHEPRLKGAEGVDEVGLGGHHGVDVLVRLGHLIDAGAQELYAAVAEHLLHMGPAVGGAGLRAAHASARTVAGRVERGCHTAAADDETGRGHRSRDDAQGPCSGGRGALAVHDHRPADAVDLVRLLPGEVVVVFDAENRLDPEVLGDVPVDQRMVGRSVPANQLHRLPILLAFLLIEREPGKVPQFFRQGGTPLHREL